MIVATQTPAENAIILDSNNTIIKIQSTNGAGYYYRATINVDGVLFDEQGWSREDAYTAAYDLKKLYNAYFEPLFSPTFDDKLEQQSHLVKQVAITVKEYTIENDVEVQSLTLPVFSIMYNIKPAAFNYTTPVAFLGAPGSTPVVPVNGKICFAFYAGPDAENVSISLDTNQGTTIDERDITITGSKVLLYQFSLAQANLAYAITHVTANVYINGAAALVRTIRINRLPDYPVKELAYLNNFGFYSYAYLDGEMQLSNAFSVETYALEDNTEKVYEINEAATYTINSGSLRAKERGIINELATSPDVRLKNGSTWLQVVTDTKKELEFKDRLHQYDEALVFTRRKGTGVENVNYVYGEIVLPNIELLTFTNDGENNLHLTYRFNNGYIAANFRLYYRRIDSETLGWVLLAGPTAPTGEFSLKISASPGAYIFYLQDDADATQKSNSKNAPII